MIWNSRPGYIANLRTALAIIDSFSLPFCKTETKLKPKQTNRNYVHTDTHIHNTYRHTHTYLRDGVGVRLSLPLAGGGEVLRSLQEK